MRPGRLSIFRIALILMLAAFTGPSPAMSADGVVICGADGVKRVVVFDFETGAPTPAAPSFHECDHCALAAPFLAPETVEAFAPSIRAETGLAAQRVFAPKAVAWLRHARAPPLSSNDRS